MQRLMDDLMSYSQFSSDNAAFSKTDLNQVLADVKVDLEVTISETGACLLIDELPQIEAIDFQIHQLFLNLISNSLKFVKSDTSPIVRITAARVRGKDVPLGLINDLNQYTKISVSDNGIGFSQQDSKKIFELFQRLHPKTEFSGTGIGLAIVKKVMENHGGFVIAKGVPLEGATFDLYFP
jgi:light-regulated signal transduction histidine kinase (bacteriophytochrome)